MPDLSGQSIGRYHILERLGEGGMATVYKAYDNRLERDVAVKIIRRTAFPPEALDRILKRFEREAKALARLSHPNIIKIIDYGDHEESPYLVMEYLPGGTLKERMGQPMPWQAAFKILLPIARALDYAHRQGMIHRDVKPSNILITADGDPMLTDFGIAKILEGGDAQTLTGTGVGVGTPEYMAPEQWTGAAVAGSDIYSLGVVLYELVTGRKPYMADTPAAILLKQASEPLPRPILYARELPDGVEKLLLKALAKKAADRFVDMAGMMRALEGLLDGKASLENFETRNAKKPIVNSETEVDPQATVDQVEEENYEKEAINYKKQKSNKAEDSYVPLGEIEAVKQKTQNTTNLPVRPTKKRNWLGWGMGLGGFVVVLLLGVAGLVWRGDLGATEIPTETASKISQPILSSTPSLTSTSTYTLTPALGIGSTEEREVDGMTMMFVPAGEITMGSAEGMMDEKPVHQVYLDAFWIDKTEVTNAMYARCYSAGACDPPFDSKSSTRSAYYANPTYADYPVTYVSWFNAETYCNWVGGRLPTEAEWEKAARGTEGWTYPWGDSTPTCSLANFGGNDGCIGDTSAVGSYPAGASFYGVLDLLGNVWELVSDWYAMSYNITFDTNPFGPVSGENRVFRGGSWDSEVIHIRSSFRNALPPNIVTDSSGFRCVTPP